MREGTCAHILAWMRTACLASRLPSDGKKDMHKDGGKNVDRGRSPSRDKKGKKGRKSSIGSERGFTTVYRRRGRRRVHGFGRRACAPVVSGPVIVGPMFLFRVGCPGGGQKRSVVLELPDKYVEQSHLGMRRRPRPKSAARDAVRVDDQYRFQVVDIGCVAARQRTIELAIVIDEDCVELGTERSPTSVASWGDGRRPPLYWVGSDPGERGPVLMYERRHFFEDD